MLTRTFAHLQGVGAKTEGDLWNAGFHTWSDIEEKKPSGFSASKWEYFRNNLSQARQNFATKPTFFTKLLPASQHWRIFSQFRQVTAYLDIETTGLGPSAYITTIALYDGTRTRTYVQGKNLDEFPIDIMEYDVLVTYNGKTFDVPVIEKYFGMLLPQAHIDLRYILGGLGFKGGLKKCEVMLGIDRDELAGVDGYMAVLLWNHFRETGDQKAMDTLLAYNIMDTVNLEILMVEAFNRHLEKTPFYETLKIPIPETPQQEITPDRDLVAKLSAYATAVG